MIVDYSTYLKKKALLADPSTDITDDVRAKVEAALQEYDAKFGVEKDAAMPLRPDAGASAINQAKGLPSQEDISQGLSHAPHQAEDLTSQLDPGFALPPQALATQPATTHPGGDEAAKDEWIRGDIANPNGRVIVYDAPMSQVQKDLAANPALLDAMGMSISPGAQVQKGDSVEKAYQQFKWREVADAAAKAGKTAYRYSQAPWLADGKNAGILDSLSLKLKSSVLPGIEQGTAFVLGVDNLGDFGLGKAGGGDLVADFGGDTGLPKRQGAVGTPIGGGKDEVVGGVTQSAQQRGASRREQFNMLEAENPKSYTAGQVYAAAPGLVEAAGKGAAKGVGLLSEAAGQKVASAAEGIGSLGEWLPSNRLWSYVTGQPATTIAGKVVGGAVKNAAASVASEGVSTAGEAADNYAQTGSPGMTAGQAGNRLLHAGEAGFALGGLGGLLHAGASGFGNWVREGDYYKQLPGTVEALGSEPRFGRGFSTPPAVEAARAEARARPGRPKPIDMIAEKTDKPLAQAVKGEEATQRAIVHQENEEVFNSPEGQQPLPASELVNTTVDKLRAMTSKSRESRTPSAVGLPNADRPMRGVLNTNVDAVSVTPIEGAIAMSPEEAQAFLHPKLQARAVEAAQTRKTVRVTDTDLATVAQDFEHDLPGVSESLAKTPTATERAPRPGNAQLESGTGTAIERTPPPPRGPAPTPELPASDTRFSPEGPDHRRVRPEPPQEAPPVESTGAGPMVKGSRPQGPREAAARETGPRGEGPPKDTRYTTQGPEARGSRWRRTGTGEPEVIETQGQPKERAPGSTAQELRRAGVKTVYVLPRQYDARRQETVIRILRTGGGDSQRARTLEDLYHASLRDRDQRSWQGEVGGFSALQKQHKQRISTSEDLRKRVAPKDSAYAATKRHGKPSTDSRNIDAVQRAAEIAGGNQPELVRGARILQPLTELQGLSTFGRSASGGGKRLPLGLSAITDATMLRGIYPVTRAMERTPHGVGPTLSRLAQTGMHDLRDDSSQKSSAPKAAAQPAAPKRKRYSRRNPEREKP